MFYIPYTKTINRGPLTLVLHIRGLVRTEQRELVGRDFRVGALFVTVQGLGVPLAGSSSKMCRWSFSARTGLQLRVAIVWD